MGDKWNGDLIRLNFINSFIISENINSIYIIVNMIFNNKFINF